MLENDVGGVLALHEAPVIARLKVPDDRAIGLSRGVESSMQAIGSQGIGKFLGLVPVVDVDDGVVDQGEADAFVLQH